MSAVSVASARPSTGTRVRAVLKRREVAVAVAALLVILIATAVNPRFLISPDGFRNLLLTPSILVVLAIAQTFVIVTRNIDLSVSATLGLTAYATGRMFSDWQGVPAPVVVVLAVLLGSALGLINGLLVAVAKVPALVITLGTLYLYRGVDVALAGSGRIDADDLPAGFSALGTGSVLGIPVLAIVAALVLLVSAVHLGTRRSGRELYAIGSDEAAARLYGLPVGRRVLTAFVVSGSLAGLAGVMYTARYATVSSNAGTGLELQAVAAAVIGGVAIFGGSGTVAGAAIGALLLTTIDRMLPTIGVQDFWQQAVVGALIIAAIVLDRVLSARTARRLRREQGSAVIAAPNDSGKVPA